MVWPNATGPSPSYAIGIENATGTGDRLIAWQLKLRLVPEVGATGSLWFDSAVEPYNYLLAGRSSGILPPFDGPSEMVGPIGDADLLFSGVPVLPAGQNLLELTFGAAPGTRGIFAIEAIPDPFDGCNWYSEDVFEGVIRDFANVPFSGGPVRLGSVLVDVAAEVPEPSAVVMLLAGAIILLAGRNLNSLYG